MKYIKLFEDWSNDKDISDNPIIKAITKGDFTDADDFDFCDAIAVYTHDYNEDTPYIHFLKDLLEEVQYKPSQTFSYKPEDISDIAKLFYDELVVTDIYSAILHSQDKYEIFKYLKETNYTFFKEVMNEIIHLTINSKDIYGILKYLKETDYNFYKNYSVLLNNNGIDDAAVMGGMGFSD